MRWLWQDDPLTFYPPIRVWRELVNNDSLIVLLIDTGLLQVDPESWTRWHAKQSQTKRRQLVKEWHHHATGSSNPPVDEWHLDQPGHFELGIVTSPIFAERVWHCQAKLPSLSRVWRWQPMVTRVIYVYHDSQFQEWSQSWGLGWQCPAHQTSHRLYGPCLPYPWFEVLVQQLESMAQLTYFPTTDSQVNWMVKDDPEAIKQLVEWLWSRRWFASIFVHAVIHTERFLVDLPADHHLHWDYCLRTPTAADAPPSSDHTTLAHVHYL
jgi:hypothetical protein